MLGGAVAAPQTPAPPWSDAARARMLPGWVAPGGPADAEQRRQVRSALVRDGEQALLNADAAAALGAFERAANLEHAADIEIGLVRSMMQAGEYRRAVAFCSHTAGAHRSDTGGAALYAWLLHAGGQTAYAQRLLDEADRYMPGDARLAEVRQRLAAAAPVPGAALLQPPARLAPYASPAALLPAGRVVSSGVLVDGGRAALVPLASLPPGDAPAAEPASPWLWVRNGLGQTVAARVAQRDQTLGLALLRLDTGLPAGDSPAPAARDAFAGSPASAIEYSTSADAAPAWPLLHQGFLGMPDAARGWQRLGVDLPAGGPRGGPVFDAAGRLAGLALPPAADEGKADRLLPLSLLRARFAEVLPGTGDTNAVTRVTAGPLAPTPLDAVYENGLRVALQVIVTASP